MALEKKPSIYVDRGTIGSSDELDEYGVWVKSEPQDMSLAHAEPREAGDVEDLDIAIPELEDLPNFDAPPEEIPEDLSLDAVDGDDFGLPDIEAGLADFDEESETDTDDGAFDAGVLEESLDAASFDENLDFADLNAEAEGESENSGSGEILDDLELPDFVESLDAESGAPAPEPAAELSEISPETLPGSENGDGLEEVSMDDLMATMAAEPEEAETEPAAELPAAGKAAPNLSNQLLMKIADELASIRAELRFLKKGFSPAKTAEPAEEAAENGFFNEEEDEKIALTGDELNNILNTADFTEESGADAAVDISAGPELPADDAAVSGSDKEDEALSIADLDVGLAEAELEALDGETELDEAAVEVLEEADFDIPLDEGEAAEEAVSPEDEIPEFAADESVDLSAGISEEPLADAAEKDVEKDEFEATLPDFTDEESDELRELREKGAEPMAFAPAPEDADFLIGDPLADGSLAVDASALEEAPLDLSAADDADEPLDLSGAVIDEPDLSSGIQDPPLEEPSPEDISISLDFSEDAFAVDSGEDENVEELVELGEAEEEEVAFPDFAEEPESEVSGEEAAEVVVPLEIEEEAETLDSLETESEEGGDLSLIPEGFVVEADNPQALPESLLEDAVPIEELEELDAEDIAAEIAEPEPDEAAAPLSPAEGWAGIPADLKKELKTVLSYMDQLLESLPDEQIAEFSQSKCYATYKELFKELGLT